MLCIRPATSYVFNELKMKKGQTLRGTCTYPGFFKGWQILTKRAQKKLYLPSKDFCPLGMNHNREGE
jgi:hypothetical protein